MDQNPQSFKVEKYKCLQYEIDRHEKQKKKMKTVPYDTTTVGDISYVNYEENEDYFVPSYCHKDEPHFLENIHARAVRNYGD